MKYIIYSFFAYSFVAYSQQLSNNYGAPSWSPDGNQIAYVLNDSNNSNLYIFNLKDESTIQITNSESSELTPAWSPDGKNIAFVSDRSGHLEIYNYTIKTKQIEKLTNFEEDVVTPSWLPDSKAIIYILFDRKKKSRKIWMSKLDGSASKIKMDQTSNYIYPRISPDGEVMIFASKNNNTDDYYHIKAYDFIRDKINEIEMLPIVSYNPSWFPNGEKIVFVNQANSEVKSASIYFGNRDGSNLKKLLGCEGGCFQPRISPDGKSIVYKNGWNEDHKGIYVYYLESAMNIKIIGEY